MDDHSVLLSPNFMLEVRQLRGSAASQQIDLSTGFTLRPCTDRLLPVAICASWVSRGTQGQILHDHAVLLSPNFILEVRQLKGSAASQQIDLSTGFTLRPYTDRLLPIAICARCLTSVVYGRSLGPFVSELYVGSETA